MRTRYARYPPGGPDGGAVLYGSSSPGVSERVRVSGAGWMARVEQGVLAMLGGVSEIHGRMLGLTSNIRISNVASGFAVCITVTTGV